jgi:TRAP-type C4-dicarboxylate transport system permease small subunit
MYLALPIGVLIRAFVVLLEAWHRLDESVDRCNPHQTTREAVDAFLSMRQHHPRAGLPEQWSVE